LFRSKNTSLLCAAIFLLCHHIIAQQPAEKPQLQDSVKTIERPFVIGKIVVQGNDKTKDYVVRRELPFAEGDSVSIAELVENFRLGKQQLINTRLFNDVVISLKSFSGYEVNVLVELKERWYIFPLPYAKPVDRNLTTWASKGYSLGRLNIGAKFTYYNTTGRNDRLRLWLITGYSRQIQASYDQPFADKSLKNGYGVNFNYAALKEVNLLTVNNQQFFLKSDSVPRARKFLQEVWSSSIQYTYRPGLKTRYLFRVGYNHSAVDSAVLNVNANYLTNTAKAKIGFPEFSTTVTYVNVDYAAYPQRGLLGEATLFKTGLSSDMNMWSLLLKGVKAWELKWKCSFSIQANGVLKLPFEQPFINRRLFGYSDFYLRGLEKYVVDGVAGGLLRNTLRRELFRFNVDVPMRSKRVNQIPFRFYAKTYADAGYAVDKYKPDETIANKMLYTAGAGIDMVTLYDIVLRFEYSFNQFGQHGLFFHFKNEF
jgi:outer membrane protein assembly factor BamA